MPIFSRVRCPRASCESGDAFGRRNAMANNILWSCELLSVRLWESISLIREGVLLHQVLISLSSVVNRIVYDVYEPLGLKYFFAG